MNNCVFCSIVAGSEPASVIYKDATIMAFMTLRPTRPGECLIIPKAHIDHFTDVDDETACRIMRVAQAIGRNIMQHFQPLRVGMVVHGFGVPHAHFILVPQHDPYDITSARFASIEDGEIVFDQRHIPRVERSVLDAHARLLGIEKGDVEEV